jgi:hypothetical protein
VQWAAAALLSLALAAGVAILGADASRVVVYNDSGDDLQELTVSACGQSRTFHNVGQRSSVWFILDANGDVTDISIATNGVAMWRGDSVEPRGGYCTSVHLRRSGQIDSFTTISSWYRLLHPESNISM